MKKKKSISSSKSKKSKKEKYRMKPNEFLFIYNIYNFEILHKRPNNDIKIYYFIKPEWFSTFKDFFNCKEIYKILDDNIKNDFFLNIIKADNIPDEFNKIKCKSDKIPKELYDFEYNGEYIIKLNEEDTQVSYYPFKVFILEQSMNSAFDIDGISFKFKKRRQGVMVKNTFYAIIDDKILEVFTYNDKEGLFVPLCLFCYNYKYDLFLDLNNNYKYKEIGQYLTEMDFPRKEYPKYIRDNKENVIGKIVYLIGDDAPNNLDNFISENKQEYFLKETLMKELVQKAKEKRLRETQRILKEEKLKEKEIKEEKRKQKEEIKERIKLNKQKLKQEQAQKEYEETIKSKKNKIKKEKEKEKEKLEEEINKKEIEERLEKQKEYYDKKEQEEKEKERLNKEKTQKEWEELLCSEKEKLELEIIENERYQTIKQIREKALYEKIKEETEKLDEERRRREAEEKAKEEARQLRIDLLLKEEEERERRTKEEKESRKRLKQKQREEEKKRIKEGFERLNKIKQEEKIKEELNKSKIKKELKEKKYWEKIKDETNKLERERIKRDQEIILRKKIIEDTRNLEQEKKITKEEKKIKNEEKKKREEQHLKHIINNNKEVKEEENKENKEKNSSKNKKRNIKNDKSKREENNKKNYITINNSSENIIEKKEKNSIKSKERVSIKSKEKISNKSKEKIPANDQESKEITINNIQTTEGDYGSEIDQRFKNIVINTEKSESEELDNYEDDGNEPKIGLKNVEAMCYMNATLQCFSKTINLTNFFLAPQNKSRILMNNALLKNEKALELCTSYYEVIENLWNKKNKKRFFTPKNFKEKLRKMNSLFQGYNSGEPKDLISFILLKLHEELNIVKKTKEKIDNNKLHSKYNIYDRYNVLNEFMTDMKIKNNSIISDLFYGVIENISECLTCKEKNKMKGLNRKFKYEFKTINYFVFPLEEIRKFRNNKFLKINSNIMTPKMMTDIINNNRVFIMDCFEFYQHPLELKGDNGDNQIYCEICQKNRDANYRTKIYYPPNIMILIFDRGENFKYKVGIDFVTSIDIAQYVDKEFTVENKFEYDLYGVITFIGENVKSGKYIAFCKCHDDTKKWVCYNDDNVAEIVDFISQVHNYGLPSVLFYERKI